MEVIDKMQFPTYLEKEEKKFSNPFFHFHDNKVEEKPYIKVTKGESKIWRKELKNIGVIKENEEYKLVNMMIRGRKKSKKIPYKHFLELDLRNKKVRLIGRKAKGEWIKL